MLHLKDLQNRVYSGKKCVRFEVSLPCNKRELVAVFERAKSIPEVTNTPVYSSCEWNMQIFIPRNRDKDTEVYNFGYIMPRDNLPLELIAATGLRYFQLYLKEEIQTKSNLDFSIGEMIQGM